MSRKKYFYLYIFSFCLSTRKLKIGNNGKTITERLLLEF